MSTGRRLTLLLVVLTLIGAPAFVLRAFCVGESCAKAGPVSASVPFCPLPSWLRDQIAAGFRDGRSPDVLAVTDDSTHVRELGGTTWPSTANVRRATEVPLLFMGPGIRGGELSSGLALDRIAPTLEPLLGLRRTHPEVRAGAAIPGVVREGSRSPLVVTIVWRAVGMPELEARPDAWPWLASRIEGATPDGAAGLAVPGSLPLDPAAVLTTIGSGGLPYQHGITGTLLRGAGRVTRAWTAAAPPSVITTLADDLDLANGQASRIGLVAPDIADRGLVGDGWYVGADHDDLRIGPGDPLPQVERLLADGYGADAIPDIVGIVLDGSLETMDRRTGAIVHAVTARVPDATIVVTATGSLRTATHALPGATIARRLDAAMGAGVASAVGSDGVFLDPAVVTERRISSDQVASALRRVTGPDGRPVVLDAYPSFSVAFARYC
ncbi:MAG: hypothetical protein ABI572_12925 [Actinomycetota bacterium]